MSRAFFMCRSIGVLPSIRAERPTLDNVWHGNKSRESFVTTRETFTLMAELSGASL